MTDVYATVLTANLSDKGGPVFRFGCTWVKWWCILEVRCTWIATRMDDPPTENEGAAASDEPAFVQRLRSIFADLKPSKDIRPLGAEATLVVSSIEISDVNHGFDLLTHERVEAVSVAWQETCAHEEAQNATHLASKIYDRLYEGCAFRDAVKFAMQAFHAKTS
jgi:hypothetical protein